MNTLLSNSISDRELEKTFETLDAGHLLLVIDACNSGQALEAEEKRRGPMNSQGLAQLAHEKGMYIITGAQSYQEAMESPILGHGYLTYVMIEEGLKRAAADKDPADGNVLLREWLNYASYHVPLLQGEKYQSKKEEQFRLKELEHDVGASSIQTPRVFYRRELEITPLIIGKNWSGLNH